MKYLKKQIIFFLLTFLASYFYLTILVHDNFKKVHSVMKGNNDLENLRRVVESRIKSPESS